MEIVTRGCTLPVDLVIGGNCVGGNIVLSLVATIALVLVSGGWRFGSRTAVSAFTSREERTAEFSTDQFGRVVRSLIAIAAADGQLADNEVNVIRYVGLEYFGIDLDEDTLRKTHDEMGSQFDVEAEIQGALGGLALQDEEAISTLVQSMTLVAACDGQISNEEIELIRRISVALGAKGETVEAFIKKAETQAAEWQLAEG